MNVNLVDLSAAGAAIAEASEQRSVVRGSGLVGGLELDVSLRGVQASPSLVAKIVAMAEAVARYEMVGPRAQSVLGHLVGQSAAIRNVARMLERVAPSNATVLITGENGTGKEVAARTVHELSKRKDQRFVAANCSAFNDNLLESEFFGHKKGAFTGAFVDKQGLFEAADGGTFFLDEVGDMTPALQVKLLRVLQEGVFFPVGATEPRKVDVRVIAATNQDLRARMAQGLFREDLFYRLNVVAVRMPPLRDRREDIPLLVDHFTKLLAERTHSSKVLSLDLLAELQQRSWPGNVRELENELERLWVLAGDEPLLSPALLSADLGARPSPVVRTHTQEGPDEGPAMPRHALATVDTRDKTLPAILEELERQVIATCLARENGNKTRAAAVLGISRRNLIRRVQALAIAPSDDVPDTEEAEPEGEL